MKVRIENIHRGKPLSNPDGPFHTYAHIINDETGELIISATFDYILDVVKERGYEVTRMELKK